MPCFLTSFFIYLRFLKSDLQVLGNSIARLEGEPCRLVASLAASASDIICYGGQLIELKFVTTRSRASFLLLNRLTVPNSFAVSLASLDWFTEQAVDLGSYCFDDRILDYIKFELARVLA